MKALADRKKDIYDEDIEWSTEMAAPTIIKLASLTVITGTHGAARDHEARRRRQIKIRGREAAARSMPCSTASSAWCRTRPGWSCTRSRGRAPSRNLDASGA